VLRLRVDPLRPDPEIIARFAAIIRDGGVVAIPTDTLYGLAADPFNERAVQRIFQIKRRQVERAVPLVAASVQQVGEALGELPASGRKLAARFWPGPLTLLMPAPPTLAPEVTGTFDTVGVRVPDHAVTLALAAACCLPLTSTSANISNEPATADPDEVAAQLPTVDGLLDSGPTSGGAPSTIVDVTRGAPVMVRAGAVAWEDIQACLRA
jgi:L-threonylcarbamoyladenylate synthase